GPEEKSFLDHRFQLFPQAAAEYEEVCRELIPAIGAAGDGGRKGLRTLGGGWQRILGDRHIAYVVLYDSDPRRLLPAMNRLVQDPQHWTLLHVDGQALIFGWKQELASADLYFDPGRLAFYPW